jgi:demethoxyubiquinone hydroxylase (CLK1/Coq7/Cat5 family)
VSALTREVENSATKRVNDHLRELADAERTIARNLENRNASDLAAVHNRMAQLYTERLIGPAGSSGKGS